MTTKIHRLSKLYALPKFGPHLWQHHEREANKRGPKLTLGIASVTFTPCSAGAL